MSLKTWAGAVGAFLFILILGLRPLPCAASPGDTIADAVLGQDNFTSAATGTSATRMSAVDGMALDRNSLRIYVSDGNNARVLSWPNATAFTNGEAADLVIGQADFTSGSNNRGGSANLNTLFSPQELAVDNNGNLYVADSVNNRVLEFDNPAVTDQNADRVFGQPDFTTTSAGLSNIKMNNPSGVAIDPLGRLFVADKNNNRVLAFDAPLDSDSVADAVWGQADFTHDDSGTTATTLFFPTGVAFDNLGNLYVADSTNHRVLQFVGGFGGNSTAGRVFGQADLNSNVVATSSSGLNNPARVCFDGNGNLYVADNNNSRLLVFNASTVIAATTNVGAAGRVFGQPDFNSANSSTTASGLDGPTGCAVDQFNNLYVADRNNARVLRYDAVVTDTALATTFTSIEPTVINSFGAGTPFPSSLIVSGITGVVSKITVSLKHLSHTFPDDLEIFLVGPTGKAAALLVHAGSSFDIYQANLIFDDSAAALLPQSAQISSGTFKPSAFTLGSAKLPVANLGSLLSVFNGENPNGEWGLYIIDRSGGDKGGLDTWGLNIYTTPVISSFTVAPATAKVGDTVTFSAAATVAPSDAASFAWDFGDGTQGTGASVTHAYSTSGSFTAAVTVTATGGTAFQSTVVTVNPGPTDLTPVSMKAKIVKGKLQCSFGVKNNGTQSAAASTAEIRFGQAVDSLGKVAKTFAVPALAAGAQSSVFTISKSAGPKKFCRFVVDSANVLVETNESNNSAAKRAK